MPFHGCVSLIFSWYENTFLKANIKVATATILEGEDGIY